MLVLYIRQKEVGFKRQNDNTGTKGINNPTSTKINNVNLTKPFPIQFGQTLVAMLATIF
jgi:hypothetical protein